MEKTVAEQNLNTKAEVWEIIKNWVWYKTISTSGPETVFGQYNEYSDSLSEFLLVNNIDNRIVESSTSYLIIHI